MELRLPQTISFHEAGILAISHAPKELTLELENVTLDDGPHNVTVWFGGVREIKCDGVLVSDFHRVYDDGEVLSFEHGGDAVRIIIEWTDFGLHRSQTKSYVVICESLAATIRA